MDSNSNNESSEYLAYMKEKEERIKAGIPAPSTETFDACKCYKARGIDKGYCDFTVRGFGGYVIPDCV